MVVAVIAAACAEPSPLKAFGAPSWTDVPQHGLTSHLTRGVELEAARGEREGAWLILQPQGAWTELTVEVTELTSPRGSLPPSQVSLRRGYFERAADGRFLADALVALERSSLRDPRHPESSNLPLWIEVEIPASTRAGLYQGVVRLRVGCEAAELPLVVQVHRVRLKGAAVRALIAAPEERHSAAALTESARQAGVDLLGGGQGGGGVQGWEIPVGDAEAVGMGLGAPATSGAAVAWLSERDDAELLLYQEGAAGLRRSVRRPESLWYRVPGSSAGVMETVRLLRLRDALELRNLISATRQRGFGAEVDRWSERLTPPGGHLSTDPDAYAAARRALLQRHDR